MSVINITGTINQNATVTGSMEAKTVSGTLAPSVSVYANIYLRVLLSYGPEALALIDRMQTVPSKGLMDLIDKTIADLIASGIWAITDKLHKWDLHSEQASLLDWKNPDRSAISYDNPVFTYKYGLATELYVNYIDLNFIPSVDCIHASLNNIAFSLDDLTGEQTLTFNFGAYNTTNDAGLLLRTMEIAALRPWLIMNAMTWKVWNGNAGVNLYYSQRADATGIRLFSSPTLLTYGASPSTKVIDQSLVLGGHRTSNGGIYKTNIATSTFWLGAVMTPEQLTAWYSIIDYWKATLPQTT